MKKINITGRNTKLKIVKTVLLTAAVVLAIYAVINAGTAASLRFKQSESAGYSRAAAVKTCRIRKFPFLFLVSDAKAEAGDEIKVLSGGGLLSSVVFEKNGEISCGFVNSSSIEIKGEGIIAASQIKMNCRNLVLEEGEELQCEASLIPYFSNEVIEWESSAPEICSVENGKLSALGEGNTVITARIKAQERSFSVTVKSAGKDFGFKSSSFELRQGESENLNKQLVESSDNIEWISSNSKIASVEGGKLRAVSSGCAIITAKCGLQVASCRVNVLSKNKNASDKLNMPNAYGNTIDYHPSVEYFENGFGGYKYWCAFTPYEKCEDKWENPHILASNDLKKWVEPKGFDNPLEPIPENYEAGSVYNSDTELVYNSKTGELECWWRFYNKPEKEVALYRKTTKDGSHWSEKQKMLAGEMYKTDFLSPSLLYENGVYKMWAINHNSNYAIQYRESTNGTDWSSPVDIKVNYKGTDKLWHWHLDVIHTIRGYEMDISSFPKNTNDHLHMSLYYSFSADNKNWSDATLLLAPNKGTSRWDNQGLYRSSLLYANGKYYLFYSGINTSKGPTGVGMISGSSVNSMS